MESDFSELVARVDRFIIYLGLAGLPVAFLIWGWRGTIGYILGAVAARLNFKRLRAMVERLGGDGKPAKVSVVKMALLYFGIGLSAYVMIKYFEVSVLSAFAGLLFVSAGAVLLEVLYSFFYGT